ncbi:hypothetical protein AXF42_Ash016729 [Apostasia shenzhenica]|uniref:Uncharacterized protein n=1 Tax=Apostasia shenzhenica TaxID=1088818 RepID=A0A2I0AQ45_9ASPA|nr:hypothetical protein AXF42_Ash016729 [Apostasia shenzhenica]
MTPRSANSRHALEAFTLQLHCWKPFQIQTLPGESTKPHSFHSKKPCRSDRSTAPPIAADCLDLSRLSLLEDPLLPKTREEGGFRWLATARKRRRRGSRSVSGRSSDRSVTRRRGGGAVSASYATCSDFPLATGGTDSSGELFVNGDGSWGSDVSEARGSRREAREGGNGGLEREGSAFGSCPLDSQGNESGYGSEPGYRGDAEFGYGDEFDEEDEDGKLLFWCGGSGETKRMEIVCESNFSEQKAHHRCRRKKNDWRILAPLR